MLRLEALEADGTSMSVHDDLIHINKAIDDDFAQAEGDLDADSRFCIGWFQQYGFETGPFGEADVLARAKGTAVDEIRSDTPYRTAVTRNWMFPTGAGFDSWNTLATNCLFRRSARVTRARP
jgi:putative DNA methylase